jgi:hypothetical protein
MGMVIEKVGVVMENGAWSLWDKIFYVIKSRPKFVGWQ